MSLSLPAVAGPLAGAGWRKLPADALASAAAGLRGAGIGVGLPDPERRLAVLTNTSLVTQENDFVGLANYATLLGDEAFWNAWRHTMVFTFVSTLLETILGLGMALLLFEPFIGRCGRAGGDAGALGHAHRRDLQDVRLAVRRPVRPRSTTCCARPG